MVKFGWSLAQKVFENLCRLVSSHSPVQRGVLVLPQLIDHWLDAQHQELIPQMEPELQIVLGNDKMDKERLQSNCTLIKFLFIFEAQILKNLAVYGIPQQFFYEIYMERMF